MSTAADHEEWRAVVGREGEYEVSSAGRVRSLDREVVAVRADGTSILRRYRGKLLTLRGGRYASVALRGKPGYQAQRTEHRLMGEAFLGARPDDLVRHLNDDGWDNRLENLALGDKRDNSLDAVRNGTHPQARKTHCPKGHTYDDANTFLYDGRRYCRACKRERSS